MSPKQICLAAATSPKEQGPLSIGTSKVFTSRLPHNSHGQLVTLAPVFGTAPGAVNGTVSLVQANNTPTFIQAPVLPAATRGSPVNILQAQPNRHPAANGCFIPMTANGISMSNGHTPINVIQTMAGQTIRVIPQQSVCNGIHPPVQLLRTAVDIEQNKLPTTTSSKRGTPSPPASALEEKRFQVRRSLSSTSSPPPLVQVIKTEAEMSHTSCSPPPQSVMAIKVPQHKNFLETTSPAPFPMQNIIVPASSLQQPLGRILLIAADGTGGLETNGTIALPVKSVLEAGQLPQTNSFVPVQLLKLPANTITTA